MRAYCKANAKDTVDSAVAACASLHAVAAKRMQQLAGPQKWRGARGEYRLAQCLRWHGTAELLRQDVGGQRIFGHVDVLHTCICSTAID